MIKSVIKTWGCEYWIVNTDKYCGKIILCEKDKWSSQGKYHYHKNKDETFYVAKGVLLLDVEGNKIVLQKGDSYRILPNTNHRFMALSKTAEVFEFSTHHEDGDSYYDRN
jgi:mannose-6-phosphate isomerase-like protein (cupin superfamily)